MVLWKESGRRYMVRNAAVADGQPGEIYGIFDNLAEAELAACHAQDAFGARTLIEPLRLTEAVLRPRKLDRETALIEATIDAISEKGFSGLTVGEIAKRAGISSAHVFTIFDSKQHLLQAVLRSMEDSYLTRFDREVAAAEGDPVRVILGVVRTDLCDELTSMRVLRAWIAFRAEARELYEATCRHGYDSGHELLCSAFAAITPARAEPNAYLLRGLIDGLLRMILVGDITPDKAREVAADMLHQLSPSHFPEGLRLFPES